MPTEKKSFVFAGLEVTLVCARTRWYVEYYTPARPGSDVKIRNRPTLNLNRIRDHQERIDRLPDLLQKHLVKSFPEAEGSMLFKVLEENRVRYRHSSYLKRRCQIRKFSKWLKGPDLAVTQQIAQSFLDHLVATGRSTSTVKSYKLVLGSLYTLAGMISPFKGTKCLTVVSQSLYYYDDDQIRTIKTWILSVAPWLWTAVLLQYYCFIRPGEIRFTKISDIKLNLGFIDMRPEVSKNKKSQKVMIPDQLREYLVRSGILDHPEDHYLISPGGQPGAIPVGKNYFNRYHAQILKDVGITGRYAFYSWKHTGVVKAVKAGINLKDLQLQGRWHSLDMLNEYLKNLGVMDSEDLRTRFPTI